MYQSELDEELAAKRVEAAITKEDKQREAESAAKQRADTYRAKLADRLNRYIARFGKIPHEKVLNMLIDSEEALFIYGLQQEAKARNHDS